ncbi:MAG TPA: tetratricopeptide repeat protein [Candidatus Limnocylindrales bacterium]|nr:tetratricopeptide repeat protein [Candidatus Limnocylindrales bacterium]
MHHTVRAIAALTAVALLSACGGNTPTTVPSDGATPGPTIAPRATPDMPPPAAQVQRLAAAQARRLAADAAERPNDASVRRDLGFVLLQLVRDTGDAGGYARAEAAFREAMDLDPQDPLVLVGIGAVQLGRHEFDAALDTGRQATALDPELPAAHGVVVDALVELGRYDEAVEALQVMVDLRADLASLARVSYLRELHGDLPGALDAMLEAARAGSTEPEGQAYVTSLLGTLFVWNGRPEEARAAWEQSLALVPGYAPAVAGIGRLATGEGDHEAAVEAFRAASDALPLPEYVIALGESSLVAGDDRGAAEAFDLARLQTQLLQAAGVGTELELALFEADHGDPASAVALATRAYEERRTIRTADALAWALHRNGRSRDAVALVDEALRLGTRDPLLRYHAGAIAAVMGDDDRARDDLALALDVDPGFSATGAREARALLASLGG